MGNNAVIYARFSSQGQNPISIEKQVDVCRAFAERNGYNIIREYCDAGITGTDDKRPGFQKMIQDANNKEFDAIIVYTNDRFSRDIQQQLGYFEKLLLLDVKIISVNENYSDDSSGFLQRIINYAMNAWYPRQLAEKIKDGNKAKDNKIRETGKATFYGGKTAYGYTTIKGSRQGERIFTINEEEADVVRKVFDWYLSGMGYKNIIAKLNKMGIKRRNGESFTTDGIRFMLKHEPYTGVFIRHTNHSNLFYSKNKKEIRSKFEEEIRIENSMPVIIDAEKFAAVQKKLAGNKDEGKRKRAKKLYLLSGIIYCGKCGSVMIGNNNGDRAYYVCPTRAKTQQCEQNAIQKDLIESVVVNFLKRVITKNVLNKFVDYIDKNKNTLSKSVENEVTTIQKKIKSIQQKISRLMDALTNTDDNSVYITKKIVDLEKEESDLKQQVQSINSQEQVKNKSISKEMIEKYINSIADIDNKTDEQKRAIIHILIDKITVISHNENNGEVGHKSKPKFDIFIEGSLGKLCVNNVSSQANQ